MIIILLIIIGVVLCLAILFGLSKINQNNKPIELNENISSPKKGQSYCDECGSELKNDNSKFCDKCGAELKYN